jgi:hypothetical protein
MAASAVAAFDDGRVDACIRRVALMRSYGLSVAEVRDLLVADGWSEEWIFLLWHAGGALCGCE